MVDLSAWRTETYVVACFYYPYYPSLQTQISPIKICKINTTSLCFLDVGIFSKHAFARTASQGYVLEIEYSKHILQMGILSCATLSKLAAHFE